MPQEIPVYKNGGVRLSRELGIVLKSARILEYLVQNGTGKVPVKRELFWGGKNCHSRGVPFEPKKGVIFKNQGAPSFFGSLYIPIIPKDMGVIVGPGVL